MKVEIMENRSKIKQSGRETQQILDKLGKRKETNHRGPDQDRKQNGKDNKRKNTQQSSDYRNRKDQAKRRRDVRSNRKYVGKGARDKSQDKKGTRNWL
mgnify:FL=1